MVSPQALQEFKEIWRKEFGVDISDEVAIEGATSLLTLFNAVYRPVKTEWLKEYEERTEYPT